MYEMIKQVAELKLKNSNTSVEKEKYFIINKILQDKDCFKIMKTETAYKLLNDLEFKQDEIKKIYNQLIFKDLTQ